ncbi:hypothetical protein TeGR_g11719 [Tetraparma gracilis]|jgi:hypothetical protein|uniref:Ureidoglycolate hydrolase n=1 Tax=Tetraparma gracilis TaxID=2962635 RepID=A0ABQ6MGX0_9STRA|nr:hypothetical protein TeGR_g11719 [Tetraparma gracilis]
MPETLSQPFVFSEENFRAPALPTGLKVHDVPLVEATDESLLGFGKVLSSADEISCENRNFEIVKWPVQGRRQLDPGTGDEAGTTEGDFLVHWTGDFFHGKNLAVHTTNNVYLDGLGAPPERASKDDATASTENCIYLWMSDYHPDGGQLFFPREPIPFVVCLGPAAVGDDVKPSDMRAFRVPAGKGVYFHPGTWHNGVYIEREHSPATFLTRQGRVHARVSASWASEFQTLLRVPLGSAS